MFSKNISKLYYIFFTGIFWFHEILKHVLFAGRLTLQHATITKVQICISKQKKKKQNKIETVIDTDKVEIEIGVNPEVPLSLREQFPAA